MLAALGPAATAAARYLRVAVPSLLEAAGAVLLTVGVALVSVPAGCVVGGVLLALGGLALDRSPRP